MSWIEEARRVGQRCEARFEALSMAEPDLPFFGLSLDRYPTGIYLRVWDRAAAKAARTHSNFGLSGHIAISVVFSALRAQVSQAKLSRRTEPWRDRFRWNRTSCRVAPTLCQPPTRSRTEFANVTT
jgi:hypothetical protein